jgi:hypothetical protein
MRTPQASSVLLVVVLLVAGLSMVPVGPASGVPVKATQTHIQAFSDGEEEVEGWASPVSHLVTEITVPAAAQVLSASMDVSTIRYGTRELALEAVPRSMWCGDLDKDGMHDDVVLAYPEAGRVEWLALDRDTGLPVEMFTYDVPDATAVVVDHLNQDNDKDLLVTSGSEGRLYLFEAVGVGIFAEPLILPVGPRPGALAAQDLNNDFRRDVAVANTGGSSVTLLRNKGALAFYPRLEEMGNGPSAIKLFDIDKDLDIDMVVAESRNDTVTVLYNVGNGNFTNATVLPTGVGPIDLDVRDVNGDSLIDVVTVCSGEDQMMVFGQASDGTFDLEEVLPVGKAPRAVMAVQANRWEDTNMDLAAVCSGSDNLTVYLSGNDLHHTVPVDIPVGGRPVAMGVLKGSSGEEDTLVVACQMPPSLVLAKPQSTAETITIGLGPGGHEGRITSVVGTTSVPVGLASQLQGYIHEHNDEASMGVLKVTIEAWGERAGWFRLSNLSVWCQANRPPRADAGRNVTVRLGEPAPLNGSASYDPDGGILKYGWLIDQPGFSHTGMVAEHVFTAPGEHMVILVVEDQWGLADQDAVWVLVNAPPVARADIPSTIIARQTVRMSAHLSEDPDGTIVDYIWDYGLGVVHGRVVDVTFTGEGVRNVTLEVVDDLGARTTTSYTVDVLPSEEPLREPAEQLPSDLGEVPGPGAVAAATAITLAALGAAASRRRR